MVLNIEVEITDPDEPNAQYGAELYRGEIGGNIIEGATESLLEGNGKVTFGDQRYKAGAVFKNGSALSTTTGTRVETRKALSRSAP